MAGSTSNIQDLRTSLEKSRWQMYNGLSRLEDRLQRGAGIPAAKVDDLAQGPFSMPASIPGLPQGQAARIMLVALMAGLAAGLSWFRRQR